MDWQVIRLLAYATTFFMSIVSAYVLMRIRVALAQIFGWFLLAIALNAGVWGLMLLMHASVGGWWEILATMNTAAQATISVVLYTALTAYKRNGHGSSNDKMA